MKKLMTKTCLPLALALLTLGGIAGCTHPGNQYTRSTGEYIDDHGIASRVKSALKDDAVYKYEDVNVTSFRGTVQLSGFVPTDEQKTRAADLASHVQGVLQVQNNITLTPKPLGEPTQKPAPETSSIK